MIVAGFGFTSRATVDSLSQALAATGYDGPIGKIATAHDKVAHPAILDLARTHGWRIEAVPPSALEAAMTETQSLTSRLTRRTGSVAEASALAGAGKDPTLIVTRQISHDRMATCAIAEGPDT
ncbi:cobalamin biosynthesis protein [uncultured Tateyamaria sp.]|uniref:cobalamin biosynthesis protein n=1 Tax=uncultured Tateyamaria sp. TaxID=455651 RepID=UPI00262E519A|nr:cobalamin biosynthesis protein [uncultured Tateyamaria sp.]